MTLERLQQLKEFRNTTCGSIWHKVNLHVHASGQDPVKIVDETIKAGITLIAITDHNNFRFVKFVQEVAKKRSDADLVVLPGIEITLEEGAHILAIFDSDFDESKQTHFLGTLKIPVNGSSNTPVKDKTCSQVLTDITDAKGITVVPHPFSEDIGFLDRARKISTRISWLESGNIGLIQISDEKVKFIGYDDDGKWQNRYILASTLATKISSTDYSLSPIAPGEAKSTSEIESGAIWLKLGSRTVRGLRQVTCEPKTCISKQEPLNDRNCILLGLTVSGGFFDGLKLGFSSDLSCIFGENHSGKTAIFDFVSFALGRDLSVLSVSRDDELDLLLRRLHAILQPNGEVNLYLSHNSQEFCLSRKFIPKYDRDLNIEGIQDGPEAYRYDPSNDELVPVNIDEAIFMPEIYSQGHVGVLRKSVQSQLSLIDELAGLSEYRKNKEELKQKLKESADMLSELYDKKEELAGLVGGLSDLKKELGENNHHLEETDNHLWENTRTIIKEVNDRIEALEEEVSDGETLKNEFLIYIAKYDKENFVLIDLLNSISIALDTYNKSTNSAISQITTSFKNLNATFSPLFKNWGDDFNTHKYKVSQLLRKKGFESPDQLLKRIETLKSQINKIEKVQQPQLNHVETQINIQRESRDKLLKEFNDTCDFIAQARQSKIEELNRLIGPDIKVTLEKPSPDSFFELLRDIYSDIASQDRRLQKRDEQFTLIVNKITPSQLLEAISNKGRFKKSDESVTTLCSACGITYNTQQVLCTITGTIKSLHKLQIFELEPDPKISVRREGTNVFADLRTELSPGEQSSSILTLALMARNVPLIIDQPEDELGYSYIVNKIVPKILESKKERQVILISHNANIPVLADAEYLIKIRNDPAESRSKCTVEVYGTFADENVCNKILELEGGERAFQIRQYRYAIPRRTEIP